MGKHSLRGSKDLFSNKSASTPGPKIESGVVEWINHFTYLRSLISPDRLVSGEISVCIQKFVYLLAIYITYNAQDAD